MKNFKIAIVALLFVAGLSNVNAQDKNNPWALSFGTNAVDFYPTNPNIPGHGAWYNEFANAEDHYNMLPAISRLSVAKYLADGFSFEVAGTLNKISKIGDNAANDLSYYAADGAVKYDLNNIIGETSFFDPYAAVGGGYTWMDNWGTGTFNAGLGVNFWFNDNLGLNLESKYKHTFESNIIQHWQHALGLVIKFGGVDTDGDGIFDKEDACPEVFGLAEFNGCPDTDGDGIIDSKDACPTVAGVAALNGCPDTDGDGITDKEDACPNEKGTKANGGCPDTDGDGVVDGKDACPTVAGPADNKGCPWPDTDKDGVADKDDKCIDLAGPASNNGCPEMTDDEVVKLKDLFKTVYFNTGKSTFLNETYPVLDESASIMVKYPITNYAIEGHADSVGGAAHNLELSSARANAVKDYLISKGVSTSYITSKGFGEDMPIATNNTSKGRALNRRVEIKLVK